MYRKSDDTEEVRILAIFLKWECTVQPDKCCKFYSCYAFTLDSDVKPQVLSARHPVIDFLSANVLTRPDISGNINPSLQKRISFEPTTTYLLKDLKPFTTYTFRLAARSKHGVGAYSNEISAETPQTRRSPSLSDTFNYCAGNTFSNAFRVLNGCSRIRKEG